MCKQPSLSDGLDSAGNEESAAEQTPTFIQRSLSFEDDSAFTTKVGKATSSSSEDDEEEPTPGWLQRAISLCSEGEDIETLASEAENNDFIDDLSFPQPFSDADNDDTYNSDLESSRGSTSTQALSNDNILSEKDNSNPVSTGVISTTTSTNKEEKQSIGSEKVNEQEPCRFLPQQPSFDCSGDVDYLVAAANIVRDALSCELDGQYKESFHLYKKCVSLLLHGVQGECICISRDQIIALHDNAAI